jgi:hypothetical protein
MKNCYRKWEGGSGKWGLCASLLPTPYPLLSA